MLQQNVFIPEWESSSFREGRKIVDATQSIDNKTINEPAHCRRLKKTKNRLVLQHDVMYLNYFFISLFSFDFQN